jgi:hypothetical protein
MDARNGNIKFLKLTRVCVSYSKWRAKPALQVKLPYILYKLHFNTFKIKSPIRVQRLVLNWQWIIYKYRYSTCNLIHGSIWWSRFRNKIENKIICGKNYLSLNHVPWTRDFSGRVLESVMGASFAFMVRIVL